MQVALHFGAPYTDENKLQLCLGKNRNILADHGVLIPRPAQFRKQLRPLMSDVMNAADTSGLRRDFLNALVGDQMPDRLVLSIDTFLGFPRNSVRDNAFFPGPFNRLVSFLRLFEQDEVALFYGIRNPATFVQHLMTAHKGEDIGQLTGHSDPYALRWSEFFERVIEECPGTPITSWCNEDTPMIWDDILRAVTGVGPEVALVGVYDLLQDILTQEGFERLETYMKDRSNLTKDQRQRVIIAFIEKFADEEALEEELNVPGWTDELVDQLTDQYDDDVGRILDMPEIAFIEP